MAAAALASDGSDLEIFEGVEDPNQDLGKAEYLEKLFLRAESVGIAKEKTEEFRWKLRTNRVEVAVIALIKAGKSTLLNAILGEEYLPAAAEPTTASIVRIRHNIQHSKGLLKIVTDGITTQHEGRKQIAEALKVVNTSRRQNPDSQMSHVSLEVNIEAFADIAGTGGIELVDTPGPNEHGKKLDREVKHVLMTTDVVLYVLDYTKLYTDDEAQMLTTLRDSVKPLLETPSNGVQRIYYLLNKADKRSRRNDPPIDDTRERLADKIAEALHPVATHVDRDSIIPISAEKALLANQVLRRFDDAAFLEDFLVKACGELFADTIGEDEYASKAKEKAPGLLKQSGLKLVKENVINMIAREKFVLCIMGICDSLSQQLCRLHNRKAIEVAAARKTSEELSYAIDALTYTRETINAELETLKARCHEFQRDIDCDAQDFFRKLQSDMTAIIDACFDSHPPAYTLELWTYVKDLIVHSKGIEAGSKDDMKAKIQNANAEVATLLAVRMDTQRSNLVNKMYGHRENFRVLIRELVQPLLNRVITEGGAALNVPLKMEALDLPLASVSGFEEETETKMKDLVEEKKTTKKEHKRGICPWDKDQEITHEEITGFQVSAQSLKNLWSCQIASQVKVSSDSVKKLIEKEIKSEVHTVQERVLSRSDAFLETLTAERDSKKEQSYELTKKRDACEREIEKINIVAEMVQQFKKRLTKDSRAQCNSVLDNESCMHSEGSFQVVDTT